MMTGMLLKSWKVVKQHVPLIKFRKGGPFRENTPSISGTSVGTEKQANTSSTFRKAEQLPVIEDWQLPPHYRRSLLDEKEIDAINSGGAI